VVTVRNVTADVPAALLVDGHQVGDLQPGAEVAVSLCDQKSLLATLPETTFFSRYRDTFSS
jgi:NAD kinase